MITMQGVTPCWLRSPSVASKYDRERLCTWVTAERAVTHVQSRSRSYFEATLGLLNQHDVTPCIVIMPYHPRALDALTNAGWRPRLTALTAYLQGLRATYHFHLLNYNTVAAFEGHTGYFLSLIH